MSDINAGKGITRSSSEENLSCVRWCIILHRATLRILVNFGLLGYIFVSYSYSYVFNIDLLSNVYSVIIFLGTITGPQSKKEFWYRIVNARRMCL